MRQHNGAVMLLAKEATAMLIRMWKRIAAGLRGARELFAMPSGSATHECIVCRTVMVNPGVCPECCGGLS